MLQTPGTEHSKSKRTVLVTGSNRGIGRAVATELARHSGHTVLFGARDEATADATVRELIGSEHPPKQPPVSVSLPLDDPRTVAARAREIEREHGPIDVLVNNAGVLLPGDADEIDIDAMQRSLAVNTMGPFALMRTLGPQMRERGWGRIVNVSSGWGSFDEGLSGPAAYATSKAALNALTLLFASRLGMNVKVNAACPGWVRTRMGGEAASRSPEEGADTIVWLATLPDDGPTGGFFRDRKLIEW